MSAAESTLILGDAQHLVATLTEVDGQVNGQVVGEAPGQPPIVALLTNSGVIPRSGPNRMNVHLAREFARMGVPSIRFDLSGLGDSGRPDGSRALLDQWVADTRAVMDHAQAHFGCARFVMIGFCSGAEVAHLVGLQDTRLRAALLWDLYAYPTLASQVRAWAHRLGRLGWRGLCHKVRGRLLARLTARLSGPTATPSRAPAAAPSNSPDKAVFTQRIQTLVDQDVELLFAFAQGNPLWFNHAGQFRAMFRGERFINQVCFEFLDTADHLLTTPNAQLAFMRMTQDWLRKHVLPKGR